MNIDRIFVAGCAGGVAGILAPSINYFPTMFKTRFEYDQLINAAMKLELPPSFKSIFVKNLTGIPTSLAVITVTSLSILGIKYVALDYFNKPKKVEILHGIVAVATTAFTFYLTRSVNLSLVNLGVSLAADFVISSKNPKFLNRIPAVVSGIFALLSRTLYSAYEYNSNNRSYKAKYSLLLKENLNEYLDYNDGAARKAAVALDNLGRGFFVDGAKKFGFGIISTSVGVTFGQIAAEVIVELTGVNEKRQNQIASICGMVAGGALSFYFTRSMVLSSVNASICGLAPICFPRKY